MPKKKPGTVPPRPADFSDPIWQGAIIFYSADLYAHFDRLGFEAAQAIAEAAGEAGLRHPLWLRNDKGKSPEFELPHLGRKSGLYCIAAQAAFIVWTQCHLATPPNPLPDSPLLRAARDGYNLWNAGTSVRAQELSPTVIG